MSLQLVDNTKRETETKLHFSYSQLNTYLICPMKYAHQYVWGTQWERRPVSMVFGKSIHKAVETFYVHLKEDEETILQDKIISVFESEFLNETKSTEPPLSFKKGETEESLKQQGIDLLKLSHSEIRPQKIVAVEVPFSVKIPDINGNKYLEILLVGYFDLIESDEQGNYLVVELKTSAQRFSSLKLEYDLQSTVYSYALDKMRHTTSENSTLVRYDVLLKTKKPAFEQYFVSRNDKDYGRVIHLINFVLKAIENRIFYRQTGWQCGDCQFKKACFT